LVENHIVILQILKRVHINQRYFRFMNTFRILTVGAINLKQKINFYVIQAAQFISIIQLQRGNEYDECKYIFYMFRGSQPIFIFHRSNHNTSRRECTSKHLYFTVCTVFDRQLVGQTKILLYSQYRIHVDYTKRSFCFYFNNLIPNYKSPVECKTYLITYAFKL